MIVNPLVSNLWQYPVPDWRERLARALAKAGSEMPAGTRIFFRADDIGAPGNNFSLLAGAFARHKTPLGLAVVPAWLTQVRFTALREACGPDDGLWCWCQHGYRHVNHEPAGQKKREFGRARPQEAKRCDIKRGLDRLQDFLGECFTALFSPPWNRCDAESLEVLAELGFAALSRTVGAKPDAPDGLPDFPIQVDLHTRKEPDPGQALDALLDELTRSLASGLCGIMLHHQRMNPESFEFLDALLSGLQKLKGAELCHFGHLLRESS